MPSAPDITTHGIIDLQDVQKQVDKIIIFFGVLAILGGIGGFFMIIFMIHFYKAYSIPLEYSPGAASFSLFAASIFLMIFGIYILRQFYFKEKKKKSKSRNQSFILLYLIIIPALFKLIIFHIHKD